MSRGQWSKYGEPAKNNESVATGRDWYCQSCQKKNNKDEIVFQYRYEGNTILICADCSDNDIEPLKRRLQSS